MNIINACATYTGDSTNESGLRTLRFEIPSTGKNPVTPIFVIPSYAAGDSCAPGYFSEKSNVLISGRLYPNTEDHQMYVIPVSPLQVIKEGIMLNHVHLAGGVGFIGEQKREDCFNFGLMCKAPKQKIISHDWDDSLGFRIVSWGDDAKRIQMLGHKGRQMVLEGILRYSTWQTADGQKRGGYSVRTRAGLYQFFGKKKTEGDVKVTPTGKKFEAAAPVIAEPYQAPKKESTVVNTSGEDALPF